MSSLRTHPDCELRDRRLARVVARCHDLPGERLFQYVKESGERVPIDSADVNAYLRMASGEDFTAKHFRTWLGTVLAVDALVAAVPARSRRERRRQMLAVVDRVAARLHNARAACRKYYVHPRLLERFEEGCLADDVARVRAKSRPIRGLSARERDVIGLLEAVEFRRGRPGRARRAG